MTDLSAIDAALPATESRSLWQTAMMRLRRNRAAMVSLVVLVFMTLAGIVGPEIAPHDYDEVYPEFVKVPPSLTPYPKPENVVPAAQSALARARLDVGAVEIADGQVRIAVTASREIDPRVARYLDRSDVFSGSELVEIAPDGLSGTLTADVRQLRFIMGTDANGRDLFSRILICLRISLLIGALATAVALLIGVLYGATAGFVGGRTDNVMMRIVDILYSLPFVFFVILLVVFFGRNMVLMFLAIGAVEWLTWRASCAARP